MSQVLTNTARTILRSRLRRHPNLGASLPAGETVGTLTNADLIQVALSLGLDVPNVEECNKFEFEKTQGASSNGAIAAADGFARLEGFGGSGLMDILPMNSNGAADARLNVEKDEVEDAEVLPGTSSETASISSATSPDANNSDDETKAKADKIVADVMAHLGKGDFVTFKGLLESLALEASKPTPAPVTIIKAAIDPSKVKGGVPNVVANRTAKDMGLKSGNTGVVVSATALNVYDAPDAPAKDARYIWPDESAAVISQIRRGHAVFMYGPAGTGKTSFAKQLAATWGRPFVRISCDDQTEASTLTGMTVPDGEGGVKWQDGQLTAAIRRPGTVILVDEPSVARPGALFVLQAVLDDDKRLHIAETGETVDVAPDVIFILADNTNGTGDTTGAYEATRRLNRAFLDRSGVTVRLDYMPADREAAAIVSHTGCTNKIADALVRLAGLSRRSATDGKVSHGIGIRRLFALAELISDGVKPEMAFQMAVLETAPHDDKEHLRQLWTANINSGSFK